MQKAVYIFSYCLSFLSCGQRAGESSSEPERAIDTIAVQLPTHHINETDQSDTHLSIFRYNGNLTDSSWVCERWMLKGKLIKNQGSFSYNTPLECSYLSRDVIEKGKTRTSYETFDSLLCEVGGTNAWNKYLFIADTTGNLTSIRHLKANLESIDAKGNFQTNEKPSYRLGETIYFQSSRDTIVQLTKDKSGRVLEKITTSKDSHDRITFQELYLSDVEKYRIYYDYTN
jgi:hypothetical protein